ncbi:uncharacterized protein A4U43_C06F6360 [Asparagus officinalis]|uniref:Uncharacterized protein n=1 Tax=Asparagus officinalis TaxID=4686 RepID=A0A5P1ENC9_ASPOF|nr:uncharacterized protein A4U43_C06F6360 [Asparagus officinalis]
MGSLMGGWDYNIKDPKKVVYQRNKSLTNEEIAAYWRSVKKTEENNENQKNMHKGSVQRFTKSKTMPSTDRRENNEQKKDDEKLSNINCLYNSYLATSVSI